MISVLIPRKSQNFRSFTGTASRVCARSCSFSKSRHKSVSRSSSTRWQTGGIIYRTSGIVYNLEGDELVLTSCQVNDILKQTGGYKNDHR